MRGSDGRASMYYSGLVSNPKIINAHDCDELLTAFYHNGMDDQILQIALLLEALNLEHQTDESTSLIIKAKIMLIHDDHANNVNWILNLTTRLRTIERKLISLRVIPFISNMRIPVIHGDVWGFLADQIEIARMNGDECALNAGLKAQALGNRIGSLVKKLGNRVQLSPGLSIEPPKSYMSVFDNRR